MGIDVDAIDDIIGCSPFTAPGIRLTSFTPWSWLNAEMPLRAALRALHRQQLCGFWSFAVHLLDSRTRFLRSIDTPADPAGSSSGNGPDPNPARSVGASHL